MVSDGTRTPMPVSLLCCPSQFLRLLSLLLGRFPSSRIAGSCGNCTSTVLRPTRGQELNQGEPSPCHL